MEPPTKRRRLSPSPGSGDIDDDSSLQIARARNDKKLKSVFEGIFEKYGKDFSDVGDEIDLRTGEIIVNKGHVSRMEHEDDTGQVAQISSQRNQSPRGQSMDDTANAFTDDSDDELIPESAVILGSLMTGRSENGAESGAESPDTDDHEIEASPPAGEVIFPDADDGAVEGNETAFSTLNFPRRQDAVYEAVVDPAWQVPEIDAKFWTPPKKQTPPKRKLNIIDTRAPSPPSAGSIWAIRTPGRPRGASSKAQKGLIKSSPILPSKRRRRKPAVLDWSFAEVRSDESDSDDPLQEEAPSSTNRSIKIRAPSSVSITPTPSKSVLVDVIKTGSNKSQHLPTANQVASENIEEIESIPGTPEVASSSPQTFEPTPTQKRYDKRLSSPTKVRPTEFILTPDEVKLIAQMKPESGDHNWGDIIEHLPGRTLDDLEEWERRHPSLFDSNYFTNDGWSLEELELLDKYADQSGIWWKDIQAALPNRSRRELENQMIRIWVERKACQKENEQFSSSGRSIESHIGYSRPSQSIYSDEDDPALRTGDVMTTKDLEDLLEEEDFGEEWPEISAIEVEPRSAENVAGFQRGSPRKGSASPRKLF